MMHTNQSQLFFNSYKDCRNGFGEAVKKYGGEVFRFPVAGYRKLATEVSRFGDSSADTVIFLTSGVHGAEQAAGTACQIDLLLSNKLSNIPKGIAVVLIHGANPWGAAYGRRYTEENVDLCRNFISFDVPPPISNGYEELRCAFDADPTDCVDANRLIADFLRTPVQ